MCLHEITLLIPFEDYNTLLLREIIQNCAKMSAVLINVQVHREITAFRSDKQEVTVIPATLLIKLSSHALPNLKAWLLKQGKLNAYITKLH